MQIILTEEEYRKLKSTYVPTDVYDAWIEKVSKASRDAGRDIIQIISPYIKNNPYFSIEPEMVRDKLKDAFKPLHDELENHPNSKTKETI